MQKRFDRQLSELINKAIIRNERDSSPVSILAGISGGPDSVCLLNLLMKSKINISVSIAHMNFSLRGEDSDGDEHFVRALAKSYGVKCYVKNVDTRAYAKSNGISIEMAARDLRYRWFNELISEHSIDYLAIAHNANDNAETLILNLVRGTGLRGLCSIRSNDKVIRPMIIFSRNQIEKYNLENNINSRIDKTNFDSEFSRNRIRNEVIPQLSIINPSIIETLNKDIENFSLAYDILSTHIYDKISKFKIAENYNSFGRVGVCKKILDRKCLVCSIDMLNLKREVGYEYYLFEILRDYGFNASQIKDIARFDGKELKKILSDLYLLVYERDVIKIYDRIFFNNNVLSASSTILEQDIKQEKFIDFGLLSFVVRESCKNDNISFNSGLSLFINADRIKYPLKIRKIENGDNFIPFGMNGKKKINDYLAEKKLDSIYKSFIPVIEDSDNNILCVPPFEINNKYKISNDTKKILNINLRYDFNDLN